MSAARTLDRLAQLAGAATALPGRYGRAASFAQAALGLASELVDAGASPRDIQEIPRMVDLRQFVSQPPPSK